MNLWEPYPYQIKAGKFIQDVFKCGVFLDMGLGKTVITLTQIDFFMNEDMSIKRTLVIAPVRVIKSVWRQEAEKWSHLNHLRISLVWGTEIERLDALRIKADIYLINPEMVVWLMTKFQTKWPFDCIVIDEFSKFKSHKSQRFKALKLMAPYTKRIIGLTGTPAPNGLMDLWAQIYLLDSGERLEKTITGYRERYFVADSIESGYAKTYRLRKEAKDAIYSKIKDICISMQAQDYIDLPDLIQNDVVIDFDPGTKALYEQFKVDQIMQLGDEEITALSAAALGNKLLQFCNGAVYHSDKSRNYTQIHKLKLDALEDIIEEANGANILLFYTYKHDLDLIKQRFPWARALKTDKDIEEWNMGKIRLLVCHPASAGHGLNLQHCGRIMVWYGLNWSLELYQQAIARLLRLGQEHSVIMHRILIRGTQDMKVAKVLNNKEEGQNDLLKAIKMEIESVRRSK